VHGRRVYVARLVQLAFHRDRRRDAVVLPRPRPHSSPDGSAVRHEGRDSPSAQPSSIEEAAGDRSHL